MRKHTPGPWFVRDSLIAAAPELLDIAKAMDAMVAAGEPCLVCATAPRLHDCRLPAIIAKAEGK